MWHTVYWCGKDLVPLEWGGPGCEKAAEKSIVEWYVYMREQKVLYVVDMLFLIQFHSKILHQADAVKTSFCGIRSGNTNG
jgi:hypothetical protein